MRRAPIVFAVSVCACGAAPDPVVAQNAAPAPLPPVATIPPPDPPPVPHVDRVRGGSPTVIVSFTELRKHPEAARVDAAIRGAPAWRAFPTIDPVRDLDWMTEQHDDILVRHDVADAQVDTAIASVARPVNLGGALRAWRGTVNDRDVVFIRAEPHLVRIAPAPRVDVAVREIRDHALVAPAFHAREALRVLIPDPSWRIGGVPEDVENARLWVDSRAADGGADVYAEADCPDAAAAQRDAPILAAAIQRKNTFPVRLITAGVLDNVDVKAVGREVELHLSASQRQIEAVLNLASSLY